MERSVLIWYFGGFGRGHCELLIGQSPQVSMFKTTVDVCRPVLIRNGLRLGLGAEIFRFFQKGTRERAAQRILNPVRNIIIPGIFCTVLHNMRTAYQK